MKNENTTTIHVSGAKEAMIVISNKKPRSGDRLLIFVKKGL